METWNFQCSVPTGEDGKTKSILSTSHRLNKQGGLSSQSSHVACGRLMVLIVGICRQWPCFGCTVCWVLLSMLIFYFGGPLPAELRALHSCSAACLLVSLCCVLPASASLTGESRRLSLRTASSASAENRSFPGRCGRRPLPWALAATVGVVGPEMVGLRKYLGLNVRRGGSQPGSRRLQDARWSGRHPFS